MTKLRECALADAERDYSARRRSDAEWLQRCADIRAAVVFGPSAEAIANHLTDLPGLRMRWGVSEESQFRAAMADYDSTYLAAIEVLIKRAHDGRTT